MILLLNQFFKYLLNLIPLFNLKKSEPIKKNIINFKPVINDFDTTIISNVSFKPKKNDRNIEIVNKSTIILVIKI